MKSFSSLLLVCAFLFFFAISGGSRAAYAGGISFWPEKIELFTVFLGEAKYQTVRVTNMSPNDVRLLDIGFTGDANNEFRIASASLPDVVEAHGGYVDILLEFYPTTLGTKSIKLYMLGVEEDGNEYKKYTYNITDVYAVASLPEPELECSLTEIDFGVINVHSSTSASLVVRNVGSTEATVTLSIANDSRGVFSITTATTVTIGVGDSTVVGFQFAPQKAGYYYADLQLAIGGLYPSVETVSLSGRAVDYWEIHYSDSVLDFGTIATTTDVPVRILHLHNTGSLPCLLELRFPPGSVFAPDKPIPDILAVGEELDIPISFAPLQEGAYDIPVTLWSSAGTAQIRLQGAFYKPAATVLIPELKVKTSQQVEVPVIVSEGMKLVNFPITACRIVVRFNASIFFPKLPFPVESDSVSGGMRTLAFTMPIGQPEPGDTLFSLQGIISLGDAESTVVEIVEMQWLNGSTSVPVQTATQSGRLLIGDIWRDQAGVRLINPNGGGLVLQVMPNPAHERVSFQLRYGENTQLEIFDLKGNQVLSLTDKLPQKDATSTTMQVDISQLPAGSYFCRLSSGNFSLVRILRIE